LAFFNTLAERRAASAPQTSRLAGLICNLRPAFNGGFIVVGQGGTVPASAFRMEAGSSEKQAFAMRAPPVAPSVARRHAAMAARTPKSALLAMSEKDYGS
jgi:hypothetical protein